MNKHTFIGLSVLGPLHTNNVAPKVPTGGVRWGLEKLDAITSLQPGEIGVIAGLCGSGKTRLLMRAVEHTLKEYGGFCTYFDSDATVEGGIFDNPAITYVCQHLYDYENLLKKIKLNGEHARIVVCDAITAYPSSNKIASLDEVIHDMKQVAAEIKVPILVGVQYNKALNGVACVQNEQDQAFEWLLSSDLALRCTKTKGREAADQIGKSLPAIRIDVLKNRHGITGVSELYELSNPAIAPQPEE